MMLLAASGSSITQLPKSAREAAAIVRNDREPHKAMASARKLGDAWRAVEQVAKLRGDIVEVGVYKGGTSMVMAWAEIHVRTTTFIRSLYLFDTYEGLPPPTKEDDVRAREQWDAIGQDASVNRTASYISGAPHVDNRGVKRWNYGPLDVVQQNMQSTGYPIHLLHFVKGRVEDTLPAGAAAGTGALPEQIAVLRLDTDFYSSTKAELSLLYPRLVRGGVLIVDDYCTWGGARKATDEFLAEHRAELANIDTDPKGLCFRATKAVDTAKQEASICTQIAQPQPPPSGYASALQAEVAAYTKSEKYSAKIAELHGTKHVDWHGGRIGEIASALRGLIDASVHSILDLGAGPGLITRHAQKLAAKVHGAGGKAGASGTTGGGVIKVDGIELVDGWVNAARTHAASRPVPGTAFHFHHGDITNISLGRTYDLLYMADSIEHVPKSRRAALWRTLSAHSHLGSRLYLHYPNELTQIAERKNADAQYFEQMIHLHSLVMEAKCVGFKMRRSEDHGKGGKGYMSVYFVRAHADGPGRRLREARAVSGAHDGGAKEQPVARGRASRGRSREPATVNGI